MLTIEKILIIKGTKVFMKIQQYKRFKFDLSGYELAASSYYQYPIFYVGDFLQAFYGYVNRAGGPIQFFESLRDSRGIWGMTFESVDLNVDIQNNLVYLSEVFGPYEADMTDDEFNIKYNNMNALQLCQNNIIDHAVMTKDNFINLLTKWGHFYDTKEPFVLLYFDENNWYDVLPFDTQEAMELFVADHTKK